MRNGARGSAPRRPRGSFESASWGLGVGGDGGSWGVGAAARDVRRGPIRARSTFRPGPLLAILGTALLTTGTALHPMQADPAVAEAAFA